MDAPPTEPGRSTYRHGDLRRALLEAGIDAGARRRPRRGGAARGDAPRRRRSQRRLPPLRQPAGAAAGGPRRGAVGAGGGDRNRARQTRPRAGDRAELARASLRAVGTGYLRFARTETGLFRTAFAAGDVVRGAGRPGEGGSTGLDPFQLLGAALDGLVAAGVLPPERRPGAEILAWSAVHGLAMLLIEGPLRLAPVQVEDISRRLLEMVEKGL